MDIRERNYIGFVRESESPMVPHVTQGNITLREGRGDAFITFFKERSKGDCENAENSGKDSGSPAETIPECCESLWKKMIGKPYSGKLNGRFVEGELEIGPG